MIRAVLAAVVLVALAATPASADGYRACNSRGGGGPRKRGMCSGKIQMSGLPTAIDSWWNASDTGAITQSSNAISQWVDSVGGRVLAQATATNKPTLVAAGGGTLGGAQHVSFDGNDYVSSDSVFWNSSSGEVWMSVDTDNASTITQCVLSEANNSTTVYMVFYVVGNTATKFSLANSKPTVSIVRSTSSLSNNTTYLLRFWSNSSAYFLSLNGTTETNVVAGGLDDGDWFTDAGAQQRTAIGLYYHNTNTQPFVGQLHSVLVVDHANLSAADASAVGRILASFVGGTYP